MMQILAYAGALFVALGSWVIPWWVERNAKTAGIVVMLAVDAGPIWFWFRYGFG
jgi:hypothetical protein